jgi:outer membrane protein assembly factor BamB
MLWSRDFSVARTLARDAKNVIVVDVSDAVHALDRASGASAWKQDKLLYRRLTAPLVHESLIIVGDGQGYLHAISQDDGSLIGRMATDGSAVIAIAPVSGGVLFQTEKGMVGLVRL